MRWLVPFSIVLLGCAPGLPGPDEAGVTTDPSGSSSGMSSATGMDETGDGMDETTAGMETSDSGFKLDLPPQPDLPVPECALTYLTVDEANALANTWPGCMLAPVDPNQFPVFVEVCVPLPPSGDCAELCPPGELCKGMEACYSWASWYQMCGPNQSADSCCLLLEAPGPITTD